MKVSIEHNGVRLTVEGETIAVDFVAELLAAIDKQKQLLTTRISGSDLIVLMERSANQRAHLREC